MTDRAVAAVVVLAVGLGAIVRLLPFLGTDFPLNDGGLFVVMTRELQEAGYRIPETTGYNGLDIPYMYSPMAFYVAGGLNDTLGIPLLDLFRILPLLFSIAMVPAFFVVARQLVRPGEAAVATLAFALLPRSWEWMVVGGGITRSLGFLLALLAIAAAIRMYRQPTARWIVATGVAAAMTALAHPQAAVFMVLSLLILLAARGRSWTGVRALLLAGAVGALVISPWLVSMVLRHGIEPFASARATGGGSMLGVILFLKLRFTGAPFMDVLGIIGFAGFAVSLAQRRWLAPIWLVLILLVDSRGGATYAMVPLALLVGIAAIAGLRAVGLQLDSARPLRTVVGRPGLSAASVAVLLMAVATNQGMIVKDDSVLHAVSPAQRSAMAWVAEELPPDASFAVVTGAERWEADRLSEWFPVLTQRHSVATFQGFEWLGKEHWRVQLDRYEQLQACSRETAPCLGAWNDAKGVDAEYVVLPKGPMAGPQGPADCCPGLRQSLLRDGEIVYDGPGATIAVMPGS